MRIPLSKGHYLDRSLPVSAQELVNFFLHLDPKSPHAPETLRGTPGTKDFCDLGTGVAVRDIYDNNVDNLLYAVSGTGVYQITAAGVATQIGTIATASGNVYFADNGTYMMLVDGSNGYVYDGTTFQEIDDSDFPVPSSVTTKDNFFLVTEVGTGNIFKSAPGDPLSWDALDFVTADGVPDNANRIIADRNDLLIYGAKSAEVYYNSSDPDFPFTRRGGGVIDLGTPAPASLARGDNTIFWLDNFGSVNRLRGYIPEIISPPAIEYLLSTLDTKSDAKGWVESYEGHAFHVLTFPTEEITIVYDNRTNEWHMRKSFKTGFTKHSRHRANCYAKFGEKHLIGDYANGKIYEYDFNTYTDDGNAIIRDFTLPPIEDYEDEHNLFLHELNIQFESGVGLISGQGSDPQAMLKVSRNRGRTWGNELWRSVGKIGEYENRAIWQGLGRSRSFIPKIRISDPVKCNVIKANYKATKGLF